MTVSCEVISLGIVFLEILIFAYMLLAVSGFRLILFII